MNNNELEYNEILKDKKSLHSFIYTPLSEAIKILEERQKDKKLQEKIEKLLDGNIPEIFKEKGLKGFQFRQIATPNHESLMFIKITKEFGLRSIFCENYNDKFTTNNKFKLSLGQIKILENNSFKKFNLIDLNSNDGKKLKEIKTLQGELLTDFHKNLFKCYNYTNDIEVIDLSGWHSQNNINLLNLYTKIFLIFISNGIMFENFLLNKDEKNFTEKVILPSFKKVFNSTGFKPLIVPIPPMDLEDSDHIIYHLPEIKEKLLWK